MGEKIVVGPITKGLRNDVLPFVIDNDSFPQLINAYSWRGRVKRKRGTSFLNRLQRFFDSTSISYNSGSTTITLDGSGNGNLITGFSLESNAGIVPGTVTITAPGPTIYTDPAQDGTLSPSGSINYASGDITIAAEAGNAVSATFVYFPNLPVMGLRDFTGTSVQFPGTIGFDTTYSYNISPTGSLNVWDVSFYKNPPTGTYINYVEKTDPTPTWWNGQDYQQFWTVNYQGALWTTNGISVPFTTTNIGMQFKPILTVTNIVGGPPASARLTLDVTGGPHNLVQGDFLFINEVLTTIGINFQTGYVTSANPQDPNFVDVTFPNATIATNGTGGIAQYLTNRSDTSKDCLRWYDGDPTNGSATAPVLNGHLGWVNFAPPLSQLSYSIADLPEKIYYLVGARMVLPFKDRLLFFGPVVQSSADNDQTYLRDTVIYSQNGTPYYTASYTNDPNPAIDTPTSPTNIFFPILVPINQTATSPAYFEDSTGFGGFVSAGLDQEILTVGSNEDVLIVGFTRLETRLVYSGNDVIPFNFFIINSELGSGSTFSAINMDKGVITQGSRGFIITSQVESARIDLEIPDEVFQVRLNQNGTERVTAQRDYINEWIYMTYPVNEINYKFPTQTLQYNYREASWGIFRESYTTYGIFRKVTGYTWLTIPWPWDQWTEPWNAGSNTLLQPQVIGGNQQGFVVFRDEGTAESNSLYIQDIVTSTVTSPDHCLISGDFIQISGALGTVSSEVNGKIFSVGLVVDKDSFTLNPPLSSGLTYLGSGVMKKLYRPFIQTKQFPVSWGLARKTRLGPQQYLLTKTSRSQITLLIFLSQDGNNAYNDGPIVPDINSANDSLIYSTILYTCPESTNLGLTPANTNLNMVTAPSQQQIWHRMNTSLLGDTVQIGFTLSDAQMRSLDPASAPLTITGATQAYPCVLTCTNSLGVGQLVLIDDVVGMTELNEKVFIVVARTNTHISIDVDSTGFGAYISGGTLTQVEPQNQFAEIEVCGFILDVSPSQVLA